MNVLVLENDQKFEQDFDRYLTTVDGEIRTIFNADCASPKKMTIGFEQNEVVMFKPTVLTYNEYNSFMMLMYSLLRKGKLAVKEIRIFCYDSDTIQEALTNMWANRREYLDKVLPHVKIFTVYHGTEKEIHI